MSLKAMHFECYAYMIFPNINSCIDILLQSTHKAASMEKIGGIRYVCWLFCLPGKGSVGLERGTGQRLLMGLTWLMGDQDPGLFSACPTSNPLEGFGGIFLHGQKYFFLLD